MRDLEDNECCYDYYHKFDTVEQKSKLLKSPRFQLYQAKIMIITIFYGYIDVKLQRQY